ncbi:hypothetical protein I9X38_19075 [Bacillus mojavensis]|nr:hypothetical protein I9X38_19075 [Bacillus mojavensis]
MTNVARAAVTGFVSLNREWKKSLDGKCYAFDKRANGMVPAEAVAVIVLKKLSKAESDGNPVYATVVKKKNTLINTIDTVSSYIAYKVS